MYPKTMTGAEVAASEGERWPQRRETYTELQSSRLQLLVPIYLLWCPFIELIFWSQRQIVHTSLLAVLAMAIISNMHKKNQKSILQNTFALTFFAYFVILAVTDLLRSLPIERSTWSVFIVAILFVNSLKNGHLNQAFYNSYLRYIRINLRIVISFHIVIFFLSRGLYTNLSIIEINPIPLLALAVSLGFFCRDRLLVFLVIIALACNYLINPQFSHLFVFLPFIILPLFKMLRLKVLQLILIVGALSFFAVSKQLLRNILTFALQFTQDNVQIRIDMDSYAFRIIDTNPLIGGHLAAPLSFLIKRGSYTSLLPFHSDLLTWLVAGGAIGLFLFLANLVFTFYREATCAAHVVIIKSSQLAMICSLLAGTFNPLFPGYALLICLAVSMV